LRREAADSFEYRDVADVVLDLARTSERSRRMRLQKLLQERKREEVVPLLELELEDCRDDNRFERVANTLAKVGGSQATDILARHARTQRRFPGIAVRALARCEDERVLPLLMDIAEFGRRSQRVSAIRALGRMKEIDSLEMLCRIAHSGGQNMGMIATHALRRKGGFDGLTASILASRELDNPSRLRKLLALETAPLGWRAFNAGKALEKAQRAPLWAATQNRAYGKDYGDTARAVLELLRAREKLLRASEARSDTAMLRAAESAQHDSKVLLRGSHLDDRDRPRAGIRGIFTLFVRFFRRT
jgi:hypothetical protein